MKIQFLHAKTLNEANATINLFGIIWNIKDVNIQFIKDSDLPYMIKVMYEDK